MTTTNDPRITPEIPGDFRARQIAYWRSEARENWMLGFTDLARLCEGFASDWEWETVPCAS